MTHDDDVDQALAAAQPAAPEPLVVIQAALYKAGKGRVVVFSCPEVGFVTREHIPGWQWPMVRARLPEPIRKLVD